MANTLIKDYDIRHLAAQQGIPPTPYQPALPARTVVERRTVCGMRYTGPGHYQYFYSPTTGQVSAVWVPDRTAGSAGQQSGTYQCWEADIEVSYPATPERPATPGRPAVPAQTLENFNLGWNAGARSISFFTDDGHATFQVRTSIVGAIVGLNNIESPIEHSGQTIDYGIYVARGIARVMENGVTKATLGEYTDATVFKITRAGSVISYQMDDATVYTSAVAVGTGAMVLQAALYSGTDQVFNPAIVQTSPPDLTGGTGSADLVLSPVQVIASDRPTYAVANLSLAPVKVSGGNNTLPIPSFAVASLELAAPAVSASGLTGGIGAANLSLAPVEVLAADHAYGAANLTLAPVQVYAYADAPGRISMASRARAGVRFRIGSADDLRFTFGGRAGMQVSIVATNDLRQAFGVRAGLGLRLLEDVVLRVAPGGRVAVPFLVLDGAAAGFDVWAVNLDNNGSSSYANYPFNSFARIGGRYYGAAAGGIFELVGDSDAGAPIDAHFSPGTLSLGSSLLKTIGWCYLGIASSGYMRLELQAAHRGEPATFTYRTSSHSVELKQQRIKLGKGLRSSYVVPTFYNEDGADFEIDTAEFHVADLSRRI